MRKVRNAEKSLYIWVDNFGVMDHYRDFREHFGDGVGGRPSVLQDVKTHPSVLPWNEKDFKRESVRERQREYRWRNGKSELQNELLGV